MAVMGHGKYKPRGLMAEYIKCKMVKVRQRVNADELYPITQFILSSAN